MPNEQQLPAPHDTKRQGTAMDSSWRNLALVGASIVALGLGVWQIRTTLTLPLGLPGGESEPAPGNVNSAATDDELRRRDTDQDGLTDYDEQYLYKTSAYLKDSDSDGFDDKAEVTSGNDPLCPPGQSCTAPAPAGTPPAAEAAAPILSAAEIRVLLKKNGVSDAELARYDDETLLAIYRELGGESQPSTGSANSTLNLTPAQQQAIAKLSGAELRQFLIDGGVDPEQLKQFDDATLKALVQQTIISP